MEIIMSRKITCRFNIQILKILKTEFLPNLVCENYNVLIYVNIDVNFSPKDFPDDSILVQAMEKDGRVPIFFHGVFCIFLPIFTLTPLRLFKIGCEHDGFSNLICSLLLESVNHSWIWQLLLIVEWSVI